MEVFKKSETSISIEDFEDAPYYSLLAKLPPELRQVHMEVIDAEGLNDTEAEEYLREVLNRRTEATTESIVSDKRLQESLEGRTAQFFKQIETTVFLDPDNYLGQGKTARVKHYEIPINGHSVPIAVKYVVSPTEKTLTASGEHDVILEVERIEIIEDIEEDAKLEFIRVPHPYFHHRTNEIQCYGMEEVDGINLEVGISAPIRKETLQKFREKFKNISLEKVFKEVEVFFNKMHTYCLHGDIKPANIMVGTNGTFYVIDFGQSILVNDISDKALGQLETLKESEIKDTQTCIQFFLQRLATDYEGAS